MCEVASRCPSTLALLIGAGVKLGSGKESQEMQARGDAILADLLAGWDSADDLVQHPFPSSFSTNACIIC